MRANLPVIIFQMAPILISLVALLVSIISLWRSIAAEQNMMRLQAVEKRTLVLNQYLFALNGMKEALKRLELGEYRCLDAGVSKTKNKNISELESVIKKMTDCYEKFQSLRGPNAMEWEEFVHRGVSFEEAAKELVKDAERILKLCDGCRSSRKL